MKNNVIVFLAIVTLASCSAPKYTYYFDHYNPDAGWKQIQISKVEALDDRMLVASAAERPVIISKPAAETRMVKKTYLQMTRAERRIVRHELKKTIGAYVEVKKKAGSEESVGAVQAMDHDLKLAAIFGAVGLVAMFIGTDVFWIIGAISLLIGVVFFVKWLVRQ